MQALGIALIPSHGITDGRSQVLGPGPSPFEPGSWPIWSRVLARLGPSLDLRLGRSDLGCPIALDLFLGKLL